jgi:hypothetical protein
MKFPCARGRAAARAWAALAIALSLLVSQSLGLLHRTLHSPLAQAAQGQQFAAAATGATSEAGRLLASWVPKHDDARQCDAFDQLNLGSALAADGASPACEAAATGVATILRFHLVPHSSRHDFQARAPPVRPVV